MQYKGKGFYGQFGGQFIPELLVPNFQKIEKAFDQFLNSPNLIDEFNQELHYYAGRPTPLYLAKNLTNYGKGAKIYLKREDLLHGGAHKTNNVIGQAIIAKIYGAKRLICETGAGQHGLAVAMIGAKYNFPVTIFMGEKDCIRQKSNVDKMKLFGAEVISVNNGSSSLKDAISEAMRYWIGHIDDVYYVFGTAAGPHPFPTMVAYFHKIIGLEAREQIIKAENNLPEAVIACVGGGSNAIGIFQAFLEDKVKLIGVEPAGDGKNHGATLNLGSIGCLHGSISKVLVDNDGQIKESHSISAGLDYPGISPIQAYLQSIDRAKFAMVTDAQAVKAYDLTCKLEGIIPALESSHAISYGLEFASKLAKDKTIIINLSGRGDKDIETINQFKNEQL